MLSYREWLRQAYKDENPCLFLLNFLGALNQPLKVASVHRLVQYICRSKSPVCDVDDDENPMKSVEGDVTRFKEDIERQKPTLPALISNFCYFSTCMTHIWLNIGEKIDRFSPIFAYVYPNKPVTYVWFNIIEDRPVSNVELVKHTLDDRPTIKAIFHIVETPGQLTTLKLSFDLSTCDYLTALNGDFMQIAVRADENYAYLQTPCKGLDCVVVLTYGYKLSGIYYNDSVKKRAFPCIYACHYD